VFAYGVGPVGGRQEIARVALIGDAAEFRRHAIACHHAAGDVGDATQIVGGAPVER
jgi:hypothetical protein